jgi:DNA polymerase I-like protein with 3'-5' exonuclease and polymerase domains
MRYSSLFQWLENYKKQTTRRGYAVLNNKRKYFDGLKSSNLEKRKKAQNFAVRWLIKY